MSRAVTPAANTCNARILDRYHLLISGKVNCFKQDVWFFHKIFIFVGKLNVSPDVNSWTRVTYETNKDWSPMNMMTPQHFNLLCLYCSVVHVERFPCKLIDFSSPYVTARLQESFPSDQIYSHRNTNSRTSQS